MSVFVTGILGIAVFYLFILGVGLWAGRKAKSQTEEELLLAGRNIGFTVGTFTLIATWVSGSYVNGTAEAMFRGGLLATQVPIGYSIALFVGGLFFVKPMRDKEYITLLDPFQKKYGPKIGSLLMVPCIAGDFFWVGSVLNALGSSLVMVTDLDPIISVVVSTIFVAAYTSMGAMYSVTYTDVAQLLLIAVGLVISTISVISNEAITKGELSKINWIGEIKRGEGWQWFDTMMLLVLGGIPWQGYYQRILAINSTRGAQILSMISMVGCMLMATPPALLGILAKSADWTSIESFQRNITIDESSVILPLTLRHLTPQWVSFFGLGAISAVAMSSADSSILAFGSLFSRNIYKNLIRKKPSDQELVWVLRASVLIISTIGAVIALTVPSIYYISILSGDLIYVILFPQLLLILYWEKGVNSYGCVASFSIGLFIRILSGEKGLGVPALIHFPGFDETQQTQKFPHRTFAMLIALLSHILTSKFTHYLFSRNYLTKKYDILHVFPETNNPIKLETKSYILN